MATTRRAEVPEIHATAMESARRAFDRARRREKAARSMALAAAIEAINAGVPEAEAARRVGIDRQGIRRAQGKQR